MEVNSWPQLIDVILKRKVAFLVTFFLVFLSSYAVLAWLDFLPEMVEEKTVTEEVLPVSQEMLVDNAVIEEKIPSVEEESTPASPIFPITMTIEALNKTVNILNPTSRAVADLDASLLEGVVRHPDSATLDQPGTVFILGHSSYLPVVRNKNFQALNGIQDLKWGDTITLTAEEGEYVYRVEKVYRAKAADVTVPIAGSENRLFLATCNSFGSKDDRYIVEADLLEVRPSVAK